MIRKINNGIYRNNILSYHNCISFIIERKNMTALQNSYLIGLEEKYGDRAVDFLNKGWEFPQQFANEFLNTYNVPEHEQEYVSEWLQQGYEEVMNEL